ncbi:hypothetical protein [Helicobacter canis]|uniref:Uncharacterized protein n=1 Tax=Helicobacter canis NCTC 12740 TaxID=1357399 RepID=V8CEW6_9HELI|nr:hypothetical protein [Helicobacter canis]ETD25637.1 hypothetical protein HMPREF2087_01465 [Helicobacter canis NCTC 12740]
MDCHDSATAESHNDKLLDSSDNALSPSLRGEAKAIHKQKELESKIDSLVYQLYNLSDDEIAIIDSKT